MDHHNQTPSTVGSLIDQAITEPTINAAKAAREQLHADLLAVIRGYEDRYGLTVRNVNLNHSLVLGYPGRTCRVLTDIEL